MELLLLFIAVVVAAVVLIWSQTRQSGYRVKNRDVRPEDTSRTRKERPGPDLSNMLD